MAELKDISTCKYCGECIGWLKTKANKNIALNWDFLDAGERLSIKQDLRVLYDPEDPRHKSALHLLHCPSQMKPDGERALKIVHVNPETGKVGLYKEFYLSDASEIWNKNMEKLEDPEKFEYKTKIKYESYLRILLRYLTRNFTRLKFEEHFENEIGKTYLGRLWIFTDEEIKELILDLNQIIEKKNDKQDS